MWNLSKWVNDYRYHYQPKSLNQLGKERGHMKNNKILPFAWFKNWLHFVMQRVTSIQVLQAEKPDTGFVIN